MVYFKRPAGSKQIQRVILGQSLTLRETYPCPDTENFKNKREMTGGNGETKSRRKWIEKGLQRDKYPLYCTVQTPGRRVIIIFFYERILICKSFNPRRGERTAGIPGAVHRYPCADKFPWSLWRCAPGFPAQHGDFSISDTIRSRSCDEFYAG